jgi:hypothetical protein
MTVPTLQPERNPSLGMDKIELSNRAPWKMACTRNARYRPVWEVGVYEQVCAARALGSWQVGPNQLCFHPAHLPETEASPKTILLRGRDCPVCNIE